MLRYPKTWLFCVMLSVSAGWYWWPASWEIVNDPPPRGRAIVAYGDSLTQGTGALPGESYPDRLAGLIGRPVINCGVAGETVAEAARRLDSQILSHRPGIVIVLLGGNDMLRRLDLDQSFVALEQVVRHIQGQGAMVVLVGLNALSPVGGAGGRYKALAHRTGCVYVPNILHDIFLHPGRMSNDRIHPNGAGYALMAERIAEALGPYL